MNSTMGFSSKLGSLTAPVCVMIRGVLAIRRISRLQTCMRSVRLYGSPEISGHECRFDLGHVIGASYRAGEAGVQGTAQSERIRPWLVANRFQAISQASMMSARLINTVLASQWLRR